VYVEGYSPPVTNQPAKLKLTCTDAGGALNRVTRGETISCTASKEPIDAAGELLIERWSFDKRVRADEPVTTAEWKGTMVESGTVMVHGTIGGFSAQPSVAVIAVSNRSWTDVLQTPRIAYDHCPVRTDACLQSPPAEFQDLGKTHLPKFTFAPALQYIEAGPNTGWWYFSGEAGPVELPRPVTLLHPEVFDPASDFYKRRNCNPVRVQQWITGHERTHWEIGLSQLKEDPINPWLEQRRIYRPGRSPDQWYNRTLQEVRRLAGGLMDPDHKLESKYPSTPCDLRLRNNTTGTP
jgi:hypothetical protein